MINTDTPLFGETGARAMLDGRSLVSVLGGDVIGTEHLLLAMAGMSDGPTEFLLAGTGITYATFYAKVEDYFGYARKREGITAFSRRVKSVVARARFLAEGAPVEHHHLLESFIGEPECPARMILSQLGVDSNCFEQEVFAAIGREKLVQEFVASLHSPGL